MTFRVGITVGRVRRELSYFPFGNSRANVDASRAFRVAGLEVSMRNFIGDVVPCSYGPLRRSVTYRNAYVPITTLCLVR